MNRNKPTNRYFDVISTSFSRTVKPPHDCEGDSYLEPCPPQQPLLPPGKSRPGPRRRLLRDPEASGAFDRRAPVVGMSSAFLSDAPRFNRQDAHLRHDLSTGTPILTLLLQTAKDEMLWGPPAMHELSARQSLVPLRVLLCDHGRPGCQSACCVPSWLWRGMTSDRIAIARVGDIMANEHHNSRIY